MTQRRSYQETHPWISFQADFRAAPADLWIMLGECASKCEHLAGVPLSPSAARRLHQVYLAKGVSATTAIEGNTLTEEQVLARIEGKLKISPSQEYQQREIDNTIRGCNLILQEIQDGTAPALTVSRVLELNRIVLEGLDLADEETVPGQARRHRVGVGRYLAAPPEDCEHLLERLCEWLNGLRSHMEGHETILAILKAVLAHLYIAWIHPFGDGNGRTARLIELQILLASGVPSPAAQLLSNHYNQTRPMYYQKLDEARKSVLSFLVYAVQGFRDGLREQITEIRYQQWEIAWVDYVHRRFDGLRRKNHDRQKALVLDLSKDAAARSIRELRELSPGVAVAYRDKTDRTILRDLLALEKMELLRQTGDGKWEPNKSAILAFLPARAHG